MVIHDESLPPILGPIRKSAKDERPPGQAVIVHGFTCDCGEFTGLRKAPPDADLRIFCSNCAQAWSVIRERKCA